MELTLLRETLLLNIFLYLKVTKNQTMTEGPSFNTSRRFATWLLTVTRRMQRICRILDCFTFNCLLYILYRF